MDLETELQDVSTVRKKLRIEVAAEAAQSELDRVADRYKKQVKLPGFRPGKAPLGLVKRHFAKDIRGEVVQKLVQDSYTQAVKERSLVPVGDPALDELNFEEGGPLKFVADFEVAPTIELLEYKGLEITAGDLSVSDEELAAELESLRQKHVRMVAVEDRPVEEGDDAAVDLKGEFILPEGDSREAPDPIADENVRVQVGDEKTHEAFSKALIGKNLAEETQFEVDYPAEYHDKKLAGHKLRFTVEVTDIKRRELPELNDEFARDLNQESLEDLRRASREKIAKDKEKNSEADFRNRLIEKLIEATPFEVPEAFVEAETDQRIRSLAINMMSQGVDPAKAGLNWPKIREDVRVESENRVRARLILAEIAKRENIEVSDEDVEKEVTEIASSSDQPIEKVRQYFQAPERREGFKRDLLRKKALEVVVSHARGV